ncbi:MAG: alkaline phosphatase D family protein [Verrucomicrobiota bacterium]
MMIRSTILGRRRFLATLGALVAGGLRALGEPVSPKIRISLKEAHRGTPEIDSMLLESYGKPLEPIRKFYLEAREIFSMDQSADFSNPALLQAAVRNDRVLMGGPLLGGLRADGLTIWIRPSLPDAMTLEVWETGGSRRQQFAIERGSPGQVRRVELRELKADTKYRYRISHHSTPLAEGAFRTAPEIDQRGPFRIAFGSCMHKIGVHNTYLSHAIRRRDPAALLLLGDIAADDREEKVNMHRADYLLRDVSTAWSELAANVPIYASWDDHDYFNNDLSGVPNRFRPSDRTALREVWKENWNNPQPDESRAGIYFNQRVGPVEIIMLDTRSCRENYRRNEYGCFLGSEQMAWLKTTLQNSTAPFKIISSGTMWSDYVSQAKDSWGTWDREGREELFNLIEQEGIGGVLLVSGDRHGARAFRIPRPSGFQFFEFEPATLGGVPGPKGIVKNCPEQIFGYDGRDFVAFGEFTFETDTAEPGVTFRLIDQSGAVLEEHHFQYGELLPKTSAQA